MKIRLAALLACMALSAPLAAQQFDTISFGVDGGYPPFDVLAPSGEITGFDIDIANALCTQLKAKCVFVKQPFESMIAALNAHKFDAIIASLNITDFKNFINLLVLKLAPTVGVENADFTYIFSDSQPGSFHKFSILVFSC